MAVEMASRRCWRSVAAMGWGGRSEAGSIGFEGPRRVVEHVLGWLPAGAKGLLSADRFYPSVEKLYRKQGVLVQTGTASPEAVLANGSASARFSCSHE